MGRTKQQQQQQQQQRKGLSSTKTETQKVTTVSRRVNQKQQQQQQSPYLSSKPQSPQKTPTRMTLFETFNQIIDGRIEIEGSRNRRTKCPPRASHCPRQRNKSTGVNTEKCHTMKDPNDPIVSNGVLASDTSNRQTSNRQTSNRQASNRQACDSLKETHQEHNDTLNQDEYIAPPRSPDIPCAPPSTPASPYSTDTDLSHPLSLALTLENQSVFDAKLSMLDTCPSLRDDNSYQEVTHDDFLHTESAPSDQTENGKANEQERALHEKSKTEPIHICFPDKNSLPETTDSDVALRLPPLVDNCEPVQHITDIKFYSGYSTHQDSSILTSGTTSWHLAANQDNTDLIETQETIVPNPMRLIPFTISPTSTTSSQKKSLSPFVTKTPSFTSLATTYPPLSPIELKDETCWSALVSGNSLAPADYTEFDYFTTNQRGGERVIGSSWGSTPLVNTLHHSI